MTVPNEERSPAEPYIAWLPVTEALDKLWDNNPKDHDIGGIISSIAEHGFRAFPVLDESSGMVVDGNGRTEALYTMSTDGRYALPDPLRQDTEGNWLMPVIRGMTFKTPQHALAYLVAANRLSELGGWDNSKLVDVLKTVAEQGNGLLETTGYDGDDLDNLIASLRIMDFARPDFAELIEQFTTKQVADKDQNWLYVEYYQDDETFAKVTEALGAALKGAHTVHPAVFLKLLEQVPNLDLKELMGDDYESWK